MSHDLLGPALTDEQKGRICGILSVGCDRQTAADFIGCSLTDIRRSMQHDSQFFADVRRAEAEVELKHMRNVQETARDKKDWRASVWWLERRSPERFARRAGAFTARQLKAFITILGDLLREGVPNIEERQPLLDRLNAMSDDIDRILRDDQCALADLVDGAETLSSNEAADAASDSFTESLLNLNDEN
jgi:hypothetical protein